MDQPLSQNWGGGTESVVVLHKNNCEVKLMQWCRSTIQWEPHSIPPTHFDLDAAECHPHQHFQVLLLLLLLH